MEEGKLFFHKRVKSSQNVAIVPFDRAFLPINGKMVILMDNVMSAQMPLFDTIIEHILVFIQKICPQLCIHGVRREEGISRKISRHFEYKYRVNSFYHSLEDSNLSCAPTIH